MSNSKTSGKSVSEKLLNLTIKAPDESLRAAFRALTTAGGDGRHGGGQAVRTEAEPGGSRTQRQKSH